MSALRPYEPDKDTLMPCILLVEDDLNLANVIVRDLRGQGFQLAHAASGQEALQKLASHAYDAVVLDWMLPDLDGLEVLRRLQAIPLAPPVLMLTARADEFARVLGLEVGAADYLTTPVSLRELAARLRALLRRVEKDRQMLSPARPEDEAPLHWGEVVIEPGPRRVAIQGQEVDLTPIEFALLDLFVRHPGRIFNRAYLIETIWRQDYVPGDRAVDNAILRLRKKLYPHGEAIEAVWGVGYRLRGGP